MLHVMRRLGILLMCVCVSIVPNGCTYTQVQAPYDGVAPLPEQPDAPPPIREFHENKLLTCTRGTNTGAGAWGLKVTVLTDQTYSVERYQTNEYRQRRILEASSSVLTSTDHNRVLSIVANSAGLKRIYGPPPDEMRTPITSASLITYHDAGADTVSVLKIHDSRVPKELQDAIDWLMRLAEDLLSSARKR